MVNCKNCNNEFIVNRHRTTFCSPKCQWSSCLKPGAKVFKRVKKGLNLVCIVCKRQYYIAQWRLKRNNSKYCSRSCLAKNHLAQFAHAYGFKKTGRPYHRYKTIMVNGKQVRLHRHIMEQHLGRKLERWEHVHHINDDSTDNRLENLEVLSNSEHQIKEHKHRRKLIISSSLD